MGRLKTIARRSFLVGSTAILGGVAFGYYKYKTPHDNPLLGDLEAGEAALTPYVLIDAQDITLITPRADKGQGAYSMQAMLIAEELDVELSDIKVNPGPPSPAYFNKAIANDAVPFAPTDQSTSANAMRGVMGGVMKLLGMQVTGGSSSTPDAYEKLRLAGAVARETLKAAAAHKTGIDRAKLTTKNGAVILPDQTRLTYQSLAKTAAEIEPVLDVTLRPTTQWRMIGKPIQRVDMLAKSTGTQKYGIDMRLANMRHVAIRLNPRKGGSVKSYDDAAAKTMRGVEKIVPVTGGVAVVANNSWRAFKAADMLDITWGNAPFAHEQADHWVALEKTIETAEPDAIPRNDGDVEKVNHTLEAEYRAPYLAHAPLEPINATILVGEDRVDVWTGHQIPRFVQANVAAISGVAEENVHVHILMMGGSFGHRLEDEVVKRCAEVAITMPGIPVKLTYSREEDTAQDYTRPIALMRARGAVENGHVSAIDMQVASPSVGDSQMGRQGLSMPGPDAMITQALWEQPYAIENYRITGYRAPVLGPVSSWRSVGASQNGFFHENFLNALIHQAGADLIEERLRLMTDIPSRKVIEAVAEMSNWGATLPENHARGVAFSLSFGTPTAEVIEISQSDAGIKLEKVWVAADVGKVIDPVNFDNQVQGGIIFGLGHALNSEITYADGRPEQENFWDFEGLRHYQTPEIFVKGLENNDRVTGMGEPSVPPAAPALAEALFQLTGTRPVEMPFNKFYDFA